MAAATTLRSAVVLTMLVASHSITMDPDATTEVRRAASEVRLLDDGVIVLVVRGAITEGARREILLRAVSADEGISLHYNKKSEKVTLESTEGDLPRSVWWSVRRPHAGTLVLTVGSRSIALHAGCKRVQSHQTPESRDLLRLLSQHNLKIYHETDAPFEVYSSEKDALDALGCNDDKEKKIEAPIESDMVEVRDIIDKDVKEMQDVRNKREEGDGPMKVDDYINNYIAQNHNSPQRGDQPSRGIESCDEILIRELILLRKSIESLQGDLRAQKAELDAIRGKQDQCCRASPPPPRCTAGSCYPG